MNTFQRDCLASLASVLESAAVLTAWASVECEPNSAAGHRPGDVYLHTHFDFRGRPFELFVYTDEAGATIDGQWFIYERPDVQNDDRLLIRVFTRFISLCVEGVSAPDAYRVANTPRSS